jgi:hypothetical protein
MRSSLFRILLLTFVITYDFVNVCNAQFSDNFSDGDFTNNPTWMPDNPGNWVVENGQLKSNSTTPGSTFYISTPSASSSSTQWEFTIRLLFNTSSANYVDVFLIASQPDLTNNSVTGYFVRIGGTPDEVSLYKVMSGSATILINGQDGVTNASSSFLRIKVIRNAANEFSLYYDASGGTNFILEGTIVDNSITSSSYFGIRVTQSTSSFFGKHFFDDFYVGDIITDTTPPEIQSVSVKSANQLEITFDEKVKSESAELTANYTVNNNVGNPSSAVLQPGGKSVLLSFSKNFPSLINSEITINRVEDLEGNALNNQKRSFFYFDKVAAQYKDVIITEIFPDPNPKIGLPEAEFIEIFNRSNYAFDLANWKITDGSSTGTLPSHILMPGEYVILTSTASAPAFSPFGKVIPATNFPTLNNAADNLVLKSPDLVIIDQVNYTDGWYRDDDKKQGGWTLELIDPQNICAESENWTASENAAGGTPGKQNSVFANKPDITGPKLVSVIALTPTQLLVTFNEKLESALPASSSLAIIPETEITQIAFGETLKQLLLSLATPIQQGQTYSFRATNIFDCSGNKILDEFNTVMFGLAEEPLEGEVIINEILFNPRPYGVDFVEIFNSSNKFFNIKNWLIGNYGTTEGTNLKAISNADYLLHPNHYVVLTTDRATLKSHYPQTQLNQVLELASLPSFPDDAGSVCVQVANRCLDYFEYDKKYHGVLLQNKEGVSLERISAIHTTNDAQNWQSASSIVGYATPGFKNSSTYSENAQSGVIHVDPPIFIPQTGVPNSTHIYYNFKAGGFVANIKIYDDRGREIKEIARQVTLNTDGFFKWEGDTNDGTQARQGYYVVWIEVYNAHGSVETYRKRVVITSGP